MTLQIADTTVNGMLDAIETDIGTSPHLKIRTGSAPATTGTADSGTVLADITLPSDWLAAASARAKSKSGTWEDLSADNAGTAAHFRIYTSGGTCKMQGTVTATGGGGDMTVDNAVFAAGQDFQVTTFTITAGNAS